MRKRKGYLIITWLSLSSSSSSLVSSPKVKRLRAFLPSWTEAKRPFVQAAALRLCGSSKTKGEGGHSPGGSTERSCVLSQFLRWVPKSTISMNLSLTHSSYSFPNFPLPQPHGWGKSAWVAYSPIRPHCQSDSSHTR